MDFLVGMAVILLIAIFYWYGRPEKFPPGPRGLPIVGVLPFLGKYPERTMKKWSEKYGPIMSVRMGSKDMVVLNDYDVVQQVSCLYWSYWMLHKIIILQQFPIIRFIKRLVNN